MSNLNWLHAPVIVFVYARPEHTIRTIESLAKNDLADETQVHIYSDAPKNEKAVESVAAVREYIDSLPRRKLFKSVKIVKAEFNKGLANSVISGVTEIIGNYGRAIVVEDDLVSAPDFLKYMNGALGYYESDRRIWSISGYTNSSKMIFPKDYRSDLYLSYRGSSWGWATWRDRWDRVDWEVSDYPQFRKSRDLRRRLNRGGRDMADMLDLQMQGRIDSWAIRWCYAQSKLDMLTVYPVVSRIKNIGLDGSGTHSGTTSEFDATIGKDASKCSFERLDLDQRIGQVFRDQFGTGFDHTVMRIKKHAKRLLGV
ncbi:Nucleotide-diphospho-sugar transferases [Acididesulfobacillus acetoxydans]|uniref:Sugar transferase n=1 Tax=Acididesulfobacillus acetoxydans TaxID=1561005 RepID=A0A8S0Y4P5_9FIRM|nr:glycosyltransferase [Acididesulfobacillus acetoxydans]CAA7603145.1 Nucleotide-diphospho-sugar transferases [Acididesulfobacillus acetoxydans]CEJ07627.1 Sugar transferase [Acididesulfobacillus acetoxydans]